jgi:hypothetical protein
LRITVSFSLDREVNSSCEAENVGLNPHFTAMTKL